MNPDDSQFPSDDALDAMLSRARWPEPSPDSTQRLLAEWRQVSPRRWTINVPLTAAAAMLIVGVAIGLTWRGKTPAPLTIGPRQAPAALLGTTPQTSFQNDLIPVREPSALEITLIEPRRPVKKKTPNPPATDDLMLRAESFVKQAEEIKSDRQLDDLAAEISPRRALTDRFARIAGTAQESHRIAAVRLLSRCADADSFPALLMFYSNRATHDAALSGVARLADAVVLGELIRDERFVSDRPILLSSLLQREPAASIPIYLSLIKDGTISTTGPAPRNVPARTMDGLFTCLNSPHLETRTAAARALGQIDGPATTIRLTKMIETDVNRREAIMALAFSNGPEAREYLARAEESSALRGAVRSVLLQLGS